METAKWGQAARSCPPPHTSLRFRQMLKQRDIRVVCSENSLILTLYIIHSVLIRSHKSAI